MSNYSFKQFVKHKVLFLLSFGFSKITVFIAPLLIAELLPKKDFGILEYALAGLGVFLNTIINLGIPAAYPYFKLKDTKTNIDNVFIAHNLWLLLYFLIVQLSYFIFNISIALYIALNVGYIVSSQLFISIKLKTKDRISSAVFFDSGIYIILLIYYLLILLKLAPASINSFSKIILIYALIYVINTAISIKKFQIKNLIKNYKIVLKYSIHVLLGGLLIFCLTVSGRILIEYFLNDYELVGIYGYYFRLAAVVVMIYQVINIAFFKKMYTLEPQILDKYFAYCFFTLYILSISLYFITPLILPSLSEFFKSTIKEYNLIYFLLSTQVIFWIATALLSNIIDRERLASKNNPKFIILLLVFILTLFILKNDISLNIFTYIHMLVIFIASVIQIFTLKQKNIHFNKSLLSLISIIFISIVIHAFF